MAHPTSISLTTVSPLPSYPCRLLQVRTRELRHVRRLAQQVLLQRSEVEAFLVSSIQLVRAQMAAEAAGAGAAAGAAAGATRVGLAPTAAADGGAGGASGDPLHQPELGGMAVTGASAGSNTDSSTPAGSCATCEGAGWTQQGSPLSCAAPSPTAAAVAATGTPAADIRTLSWQDRERVLRLLFAKINRAAAQVRRGGGIGWLCWAAHACAGIAGYRQGIVHETLVGLSRHAFCTMPLAARGAPGSGGCTPAAAARTGN